MARAQLYVFYSIIHAKLCLTIQKYTNTQSTTTTITTTTTTTSRKKWYFSFFFVFPSSLGAFSFLSLCERAHSQQIALSHFTLALFSHLFIWFYRLVFQLIYVWFAVAQTATLPYMPWHPIHLYTHTFCVAFCASSESQATNGKILWQ